MKKQMKKIMAILCVAIAVFVISVPVIAVSETVDSEIAASDETNETDAEGSTESKAWPAAFAVGFAAAAEQLQWVLQLARHPTEFQDSRKQRVIYVQTLCLVLYLSKHSLYMR